MEEMCSLMFLFSSTICHKKRNIFHKAQFKTNKTVADRKNGYKEQLHYRFQTYLQYFRQNLLFAPPSSYQVLSNVFWRKIRLIVPVVHHQTSSLKMIAMFFIMEQILISLTQIMLILLKQEE